MLEMFQRRGESCFFALRMKHDFGTSCTLHPNADFHFHEVLGGEASAEADKADQTALSVLMIFLLKEGTDASNTKELSVFTKHPGKGPSSILVREVQGSYSGTPHYPSSEQGGEGSSVSCACIWVSFKPVT